jgi:preprotein translocase subunit YajC
MMIDSLQTVLAVAPRPSEEGGQSLLLTFLPMILIFVVFYFLLIAPARKKQKQHGEMLNQLKNGDRVITNGGIHGTIVGVTDDLVQLRIAEKTKIDVSKQAIAAMQASAEE